jgi:peptidoglycan/xylan/chitin deacetylase (PgdA/CDA1 family)
MFIKIKKLIKSTFYLLATTIGIHHLFRYLNRKKVLILMYHGVTDRETDMFCWWQLPVSKFEEQMSYLKKYYTVLPLEYVIECLKACKELPPYTAVITFDDGYRNNLTVAYPILKKYNFPATIFLTTGFIGKDRLLWPDELYCAFARTSRETLDMCDEEMGVFDLRCNGKKGASFHHFQKKLHSFSVPEKDRLAHVAIQRLKTAAQQAEEFDRVQHEFRLMAWEDAVAMKGSGLISFGAHSVSHEILTRLSAGEKEKEIAASCASVRAETGDQAISFAYPNGDYDEEVIDLLRAENVFCALTVKRGLNAPGDDLYMLKRIGIGADSALLYLKIIFSGMF